MEKRTCSTTEKRIWHKTEFWKWVYRGWLGAILLIVISTVWQTCLELSIKPFDFPDKSHEVVEDVSNLEIIREPKKEWKTGFASWYDYSLKGYPNYSREHFTAASRDYPKGTKLQVCYDSILNEKFTTCVTVRVNDYGPEKTKHPDRIIDLSSAAFSKLAPLSWGLIGVRVSKID